jgi:hypothetical protein
MSSYVCPIWISMFDTNGRLNPANRKSAIYDLNNLLYLQTFRKCDTLRLCGLILLEL